MQSSRGRARRKYRRLSRPRSPRRPLPRRRTSPISSNLSRNRSISSSRNTSSPRKLNRNTSSLHRPRRMHQQLRLPAGIRSTAHARSAVQFSVRRQCAKDAAQAAPRASCVARRSGRVRSPARLTQTPCAGNSPALPPVNPVGVAPGFGGRRRSKCDGPASRSTARIRALRWRGRQLAERRSLHALRLIGVRSLNDPRHQHLAPACRRRGKDGGFARARSGVHRRGGSRSARRPRRRYKARRGCGCRYGRHRFQGLRAAYQSPP